MVNTFVGHEMSSTGDSTKREVGPRYTQKCLQFT
jgi:hypothetical protein